MIDLFSSSDGIPVLPSCMISVSATLSPETRSLRYCIPIKGVISDTKQINIFRPLEPTVQPGKVIVIVCMPAHCRVAK